MIITSWQASRKHTAYSLVINPENIQAAAIYGSESNYGIGLQGNQINFNITSQEMINALVLSVDFADALDCSDLGSAIDAYLYLKFKDNSIEVYNLFDGWSHLCKVGFYGECFFISEPGQPLFEAHVQ